MKIALLYTYISGVLVVHSPYYSLCHGTHCFSKTKECPLLRDERRPILYKEL